MPGPLDGIRVVDFSEIASGPFCTMQLAAQGAEVIKIEPPAGEKLRDPTNFRNGMPAFFANVNRGKRSLALDLKQEEGLAIARQIAKAADVLVHNWRPGIAEKLGLGYADLRTLNENLIYASVSGYGETGPLHDQRVLDPVIQALTGYVASQVNPEVPIPDLVRNTAVDKATAMALAQAITAALFARERGAGGQSIHVPMIDAGLWFLFPDAGERHTLLGDGVENEYSTGDSLRLWETSDGQIVYFLTTADDWARLAEALGNPEGMEAGDFYAFYGVGDKDKASEVGTIVMRALRKLSTREAVETLRAHDIAVAPALGWDEVFTQEQILHNQTVVEDEHPVFGPLSVY